MENTAHNELTDLDKSIAGIVVTPEMIVINSDLFEVWTQCITNELIDREAQSRCKNDL